MNKRKHNSELKYQRNSKRSKLDDGFRHLTIKCTLNSILNTENGKDVKNGIEQVLIKRSLMAIEAGKLVDLYLHIYCQELPLQPMHIIEQVFIDRAFICVSKCISMDFA